MARIEFTDNYEDLSTGKGFQFKFYCETCGNGYMSSWKPNKSGIAGGLLRSAGGMLGGILGNAAASSYEIQEMIGAMGLNSIESLRGNRERLRGIGLSSEELEILGVKPAGR